jgi:hypothetical protein
MGLKVRFCIMMDKILLFRVVLKQPEESLKTQINIISLPRLEQYQKLNLKKKEHWKEWRLKESIKSP